MAVGPTFPTTRETPAVAMELVLRALSTAAPVADNAEMQHEPVSTFASTSDFCQSHGQGATIEMENEVTLQKRFNDSRCHFKGWVICPLKSPTHQGRSRQAWLFLVVPPQSPDSVFPQISDRCRLFVDQPFFIDGEPKVPGFLDAERVDNPMEAAGALAFATYAAFKVYLPTFNDKQGKPVNLFGDMALCPSDRDDQIRQANISHWTSVNVIINIRVNLTTFNSEMGALHYLADIKRDETRDAAKKSREAFEYLCDFTQPPPSMTNLFDYLPHLADPSSAELPSLLVQRYKGLNSDHKAAYEALSSIPAGMHMVSGCPGAGKTHWNVLVAAIASSKPIMRDGATKKTKILYLLDVNKPTDDVADRMYRLFKDAGLDRKVIRMKSWPTELRQSEYLADYQADNGKCRLNFSTAFAQVASKEIWRSRNPSLVQEEARAPTLDEAAWAHFKAHEDKYEPLSLSIKALLGRGVQTRREMDALRGLVYRLYTDTLHEADFVATTPVSACGQFSSMFSPDLVFIDEAPHQRELTTLIPLAFFEPFAWIMSGDRRQTLPFVSGANTMATKCADLRPNPYAKQLLVSTMERAELAGAPMSHLLYNHRAYGNLDRLGSVLFYDGKMVSGIAPDLRYPPSVAHLRSYLARFNGGMPCVEPRLVLSVTNSREMMQMNSFFNPTHERWVMARVKELLVDKDFVQVNRVDRPGKIMIVAPYTAATANYRDMVKRLPPQHRERVDVRTIDTAQGHESDVVFLDLVRTTTPGFLDDSHRLCVAVTRARQAEIILMHPAIRTRRVGHEELPTKYLGRLWDDAYLRGQIATV